MSKSFDAVRGPRGRTQAPCRRDGGSIRIVRGRGFAHALDNNFKHPDREVRVFFEESPEIPSHQLQAACALFCGDSSRTDALFHQRHLAKELSGSHAPQALPLAGDVYAPVSDEKEANARFTLLYDHRPGFVNTFFDRPRNELQLSGGQRTEDGDLLEIRECRALGHRPPRVRR